MEAARANEQVVGCEDSACEDTCRARGRPIVRGADLSCEAKTCWRRFILVGNLSRKLPTGRNQDVLPVMVLTRVFSPLYLESWPS
jgi:hypothetical protein